MSNLYQDAILDAKALRASAMANAKAALEEAFEPKIQEMIAKHLSEEDEKADMEEYGVKEEGEDVEGGKMEGEDADIKEEELDEILNQLEELSSKEDEKTLKEAEEGEEEGEESEEEGGEEEEGSEEDSEESEEGEAEEGGEEVGDETKIVDITLGDLKQVIQSLMAGQEEMPAEEETEEGGEEGEEGAEAETEEGGEEKSEEEVSLDEILDELEAEGKTGLPTDSGIADVGEYDANDVQSIDLQGDETHTRGQATREGEEMYERKKMKEEGKKHDKKEEGKMAKELKEARATINTLRKDLQEVNLLNAKYLYMNKLFKAKPLSESQKLKVINTLDRATTVKEVKRAFEIMNESLSTKKSQLKESVGFASKPAGVAPKANIVESEQFINRWQKLAGIK